MAFMEKQVERMQAWIVETTNGSECVPFDLVGSNVEACLQYLEGEPRVDENDKIEAELVEGWFCRLSAPGYMDCTEWSGPHQTRIQALAELDRMFGDDDENDETDCRW